MRFIFFALILLLTGCRMPGIKHDKPAGRQIEAGHKIPHLENGAVPQGLAFLPEENILLISYYYTDGRPSIIVSMDWETGHVKHSVELREPDGSLHRGHVGGIEAAASNLWVASDGYLYCFALSDILEQQQAVPFGAYKTEATEEVAYCVYHQDEIWAGEFALNDKYPTHPAHHLVDREGSPRSGWVSAHSIDMLISNNEHAGALRILSIPDKTQDILFAGDHIILSRSYGRMGSSTIEVYVNPLTEPPHLTVRTSPNADVPLWFLDGSNRVRSMTLPPMTENIELIDGQLVILFESAAKKYRRFGRDPHDHFILLALDEVISK